MVHSIRFASQFLTKKVNKVASFVIKLKRFFNNPKLHHQVVFLIFLIYFRHLPKSFRLVSIAEKPERYF
jgi:hypothetical protein